MSYTVKPGVYCVRFAVLDRYRRVVFHGDTLRVFSVMPRANEALQDDLRVVDLPVRWTLHGAHSDILFGDDEPGVGARLASEATGIGNAPVLDGQRRARQS